MKLPNQIQSEINKYNIVNSKFLLAVSGGVDSMVLLHSFHRLNLPFEVAHVNYGFRPEAALKEQELVMNTCKQLGIVCHLHQLDGYQSLEESNISNLQNFARVERYQFFNQLLDSRDLQFIVTAHHQDDLIETVLYNFIKGAGWKGLKGIEVMKNNLFRPLLTLSKQELYDYADDFSVLYLNDESNFTSNYDRNFLRNEVIPLLQRRFPNIQHNVSKSINNIKEGYSILDNIITQRLKNILIKEESRIVAIHVNKLKRDSLKESISLEILESHQFSRSYLSHFNRLLESRQGAHMSNDRFSFIKEGDLIKVVEKGNCKQNTWIVNSLEECNNLILNSINRKFELTLEVREKLDLSKLSGMALNADLLEFPIIIRPFRSGDYFYPLGLNKKKKVSKTLIDAKVPVNERSNTLVIQSGDKIAAVLGHRIDHRFRLKEGNGNTIQLMIKEL